MHLNHKTLETIAHPFRLVAGRVASVPVGSDAAINQHIAVLATTRRGERPLVPAFGITDPAFRAVDIAEVNAGLSLFGPAVRVTGTDMRIIDTTTVAVTLTWLASGRQL